MPLRKLFMLLKYQKCHRILSPRNVPDICKQVQCSITYSKLISKNETPLDLANDSFEESGIKIEDLSKPPVKLTVYFSEEKVKKKIDARVGMTVLEAILNYDNNMLTTACDGQLCCQTCHCLVSEDDMCYFTKAEESEQDLLDEFKNCKPNSRLACQMVITKEFENVQIELVSEIKDDNSAKK